MRGFHLVAEQVLVRFPMRVVRINVHHTSAVCNNLIAMSPDATVLLSRFEKESRFLELNIRSAKGESINRMMSHILAVLEQGFNGKNILDCLWSHLPKHQHFKVSRLITFIFNNRRAKRGMYIDREANARSSESSKIPSTLIHQII